MDSSNINSIHKLFKKGQDALKTSFFSFKFNPDHLSAVSYFTEAAHGYRKHKLFNESILAFNEAIKCNKELHESWAQGQNYKELAEIFIYDLNQFNDGWKCLQNSSLSFKIAGKFTSGIKVYQDFSEKAIELQKMDQALIFLKQAVEDCLEHTHDDLVRISLEEVFNKLLDVYCNLKKFEDAIILTEKYIKLQKTLKNEPKHKISKNYLKLGMLRIIIDELYMAENVVDDMFSVYDSSCADDIEDLKKLNKSFKEFNKKDFNYLVVYAFSLFSNNLLKALRSVFESRMQGNANGNVINSNNTNRNVIFVDRIIPTDISNISMNETNANSDINLEYDQESNQNVQNNVNENTHADDYL
jgi:hypothetical protein